MSRLTELERADVSPEAHSIWDEVAGTRGSVRGPFQVLIRVPELCERVDHPWFIGVQYHPELKSRPFDPHPLFASFIGAARTRSRLV